MLKVCTRCAVSKPKSDFYTNRGRLRAACKLCILADNASRPHSANRPDRPSYPPSAEYLARKNTKRRASRLVLTPQERDQSLAARRAERAANKLHIAAQRRAQYLRNIDAIRARRRATGKLRKTQRLACESIRRARKAAVAYEKIDPREIFVAAGYVCYICSTDVSETVGRYHPQKATVDHKIPLARYGTHTRGNLGCACLECNIRKGSKMLADVSHLRAAA